MIKSLPVCCLVLLLTSGCLFSRRSAPKDNGPITTEVQETFRKRWVDKRTAELATQGIAADAARTQAETEFRARYDFKSPPAK